MISTKRRQLSRLGSRERGFTLIELMVALFLGMLVVAATVATLLVARQGFTTVDASSQLRDNTRFAAEILQRIIQQAGYRDVPYATATRSAEFKYAGMPSATEPAYVSGFNNAVIGSSPPWDSSNGSRTASTAGCGSATDTACINGSDLLTIRFQVSASYTGSASSDQSVINCGGSSDALPPINLQDRLINVFHVGLSKGEPALMCSYQNSASGTWQTQPLVQGVESFQVLYGVDNVTPNAVSGTTPDTVPDRYLRADELVVSGNDAATRANWLRVRSIRVGLLVRGPLGSSLEKVSSVYYPLGMGVWASAADPSATFNAPADGRMRQTLTFTMYLPNPQEM